MTVSSIKRHQPHRQRRRLHHRRALPARPAGQRDAQAGGARAGADPVAQRSQQLDAARARPSANKTAPPKKPADRVQRDLAVAGVPEQQQGKRERLRTSAQPRPMPPAAPGRAAARAAAARPPSRSTGTAAKPRISTMPAAAACSAGHQLGGGSGISIIAVASPISAQWAAQPTTAPTAAPARDSHSISSSSDRHQQPLARAQAT